jgi:uncharacterized protein YdeI (YjbR/CyaY-like superfamily)
MKAGPDDAIFFESPAEFRSWLEAHGETRTEVWVGLHRKASQRPTLTWELAVDEALCFGWIDGRAHRVDAERWALRYTPRRRDSNWSAKNVRRIPELIAEGRMRPAGLRAFEARDPSRTSYSYEAGYLLLDPGFEARLRANLPAWEWFSSQAPSYRRLTSHWVMSAKREETRERRLEALIEDSAHGRPIGPMSPGRRP